MKQYLKFSVLIVFVTLSGCLFAQKYSPEIYKEEQEAFRREMNRLDSLCKASEPRKNIQAGDEKWYEPENITMFDMQGNPLYKHSWTYIDANCGMTRNVLTEVWEDFNMNENEYVKNRRRTFTYDKKGNWTHCLIENWNGESWVNYWRAECTYDEKNRMTLQTQDIIYEGKWAKQLRWTNKWTDFDSVTDRMFERATIDGIWVETMHQIWTYDASGNLLQEGLQTLKVKEDSGYYWSGYSGNIYTYNEKDHVIKRVSTNEGDSVRREIYTYDEQGNKISTINAKYTSGTWLNSYRNEWTYENKRKKTQSYDRSINDTWQHYGFQTWEYDERGNILEWHNDTYDSLGQERINNYRMYYTYDKDNHLLTLDQEIYNLDSSKWLDNYSEVYTYDANGNKLTEVWHSIWGPTLTKIVDLRWTYDEKGNSTLVKATLLPDKVGYLLYYNNSAASYGLPYFMLFTVSASYVDIRSGVAVNSITLNKTNLDLPIGKTFQLEATINPTEATNKEIRWTSSDDNIVSVSSDGLVKVLKQGSATVTVTAVDGGLTDHCMVKSEVSIDDIEAAGIDIFTSNNSIVINSDVLIKDVSVQDMAGRLVYKSNQANPINTSSWSNGIYIVKAINSNNLMRVHKILVK